jgi:hypothetical protein
MNVIMSYLVYYTAHGDPKSSKSEDSAYANISSSLTGTFDPKISASLKTTLLDLSASDTSGLSMFDILAESYGAKSSVFSLLSAYSNGS